MLKFTKITPILFGLLCAGGVVFAQDSASSPGVEPQAIDQPKGASKEAAGDIEIDMAKLSQAFGNFIGKNIQGPGVKFDVDNLIQGIRDGAAGKPSPLNEKEYEQMMLALQQKAYKEMSETNLSSANEFMKKNSSESGVKEIVPGELQYQILQDGSGNEVSGHSSPKINYTGKYQDGTVFGSSEEMGGPITVPLDQTIPGFSKGIVGMKEGEKRRLFVHPNLGYGTTGQLPPNELLIFDIEVVKADAGDDANKDASDNDEDDDDEYYFDEEEFDISTPNKK